MLIAAVVLALAFLVFYFATRKTALSQVTGNQSAFAKIAAAHEKNQTAEGKIISVQIAARSQQDAAADLKSRALKAHAEIDEAHAAFDEVHELLG